MGTLSRVVQPANDEKVKELVCLEANSMRKRTFRIHGLGEGLAAWEKDVSSIYRVCEADDELTA